MNKPKTKKKVLLNALGVTIAFAILLTPAPTIDAADHGDGIAAPLDRPCDIADIFGFLDPNDNKRIVFVLTLVGFIAPGENEAFGFFDPGVRYRFGIENTGDEVPDRFLDVTFTKPTSRSIAQTATITDSAGGSFTAPTTLASAQLQCDGDDDSDDDSDESPCKVPPRVITTDSETGRRFFAGLANDPFFFDVPAEILYRDSRFEGTTPPRGTPENPDPTSIDPTVFKRARDTFAGYNVLAIALSVPVEQLKGPAGNILGVFASTARNSTVTRRGGFIEGSGDFVQVDSLATPVVNVVLTAPYTDRDRFNHLGPDSISLSAGIVTTLRRLQTREAGIDALEQIVVANGDYLRIDTSIPNKGPEGGDNPEAAFPNGRRLGDDVTRTIISIINNILDKNPKNPNEGDVDDGLTDDEEPYLNEYPFVAPALQPLPKKKDRDKTMN